jgi:opacity protein-like surface antigen
MGIALLGTRDGTCRSRLAPGRVDGSFNNDFLFNDLDDDVDRTDDSFGINVGGGFDFAIIRRVSLGLDFRYHNAPSTP